MLLPVDCQQDNHRQPCLERAKFAKTAEGRTASQFSSARRTLSSKEEKLTVDVPRPRMAAVIPVPTES